MGKIKLLKQVVDDLKQLAESLEVLCESIETNDVATPMTKEDTSIPRVGLEDVRSVLAEKSRLGHTNAIKEILKSLGADKLSEVKQSDYGILLEKVEVLGDE